MGSIGGPKPVIRCFNCGSERVVIDEDRELGKCLKCGSSWGGASFWRY